MIELWIRWKSVAKKIGHFQSTLIFSLLYFIIIAPVGIFTAILTDYHDQKSKKAWKKFISQADTLTQMKSQ